MVKRFIRSELAASSAEYALIIALVGGFGMAGLALKNSVTAAVSQQAQAIVADDVPSSSGGSSGGTPTPTPTPAPTATPTPTPSPTPTAPPTDPCNKGNGKGKGNCK
jgi:Flp pilus assembly pilin Flp